MATSHQSGIVEHVNNVYERFFANMDIDPATGVLPCGSKKFATFPYIGSRYGLSGRAQAARGGAGHRAKMKHRGKSRHWSVGARK